jgi:hypothetical protein
MKSVKVSGRFVYKNGMPVMGRVRFIPNQIWVEHEGQTYPVPAPDVALVNGYFECEVIRTDEDPVGPWFYTVESPIGKWNIVIDSDGPLKLRNLMPKKRPA